MLNSEKPLVLLVDDNEPTCTLMTALLQKDFTVEIATDGREALDKLRTKSYGSVILDLLMPYLDGYGVLDYLQENNPEILPRVLVVSAALTRADISRVKRYKVCGIIPKPFEVETLLSSVRQCVDPSAPRRSMFTSGVILLLADLLRQRFL